jgi:hypothetical protein
MELVLDLGIDARVIQYLPVHLAYPGYSVYGLIAAGIVRLLIGRRAGSFPCSEKEPRNPVKKDHFFLSSAGA